jgi:hypothetical protein
MKQIRVQWLTLETGPTFRVVDEIENLRHSEIQITAWLLLVIRITQRCAA